MVVLCVNEKLEGQEIRRLADGSASTKNQAGQRPAFMRCGAMHPLPPQG
jgi:hypothetical protein